LEHLLGERAGCGGGDDEVVDVGEASAVDADRGHDPVDVGVRLSIAMWSVPVEVAPPGVVAVWRTAPSGVTGWL
jgi:hypothetical protein